MKNTHKINILKVAKKSSASELANFKSLIEIIGEESLLETLREFKNKGFFICNDINSIQGLSEKGLDELERLEKKVPNLLKAIVIAIITLIAIPTINNFIKHKIDNNKKQSTQHIKSEKS